MGEEDGTEMIDRHLHAEGGGTHNHDHHDHDHLHDHDHHSVNALDDVRRQLRGSSFRLGNKKERSLAGEEAPYDYQVDSCYYFSYKKCLYANHYYIMSSPALLPYRTPPQSKRHLHRSKYRI